jgi:hypothetical protein
MLWPRAGADSVLSQGSPQAPKHLFKIVNSALVKMKTKNTELTTAIFDTNHNF